MPIDNFTTDKYVGQEEELLEYVTVIADKFHPDMEIQEDGSSVLLPSQSPYQFMQRYNAGTVSYTHLQSLSGSSFFQHTK